MIDHNEFMKFLPKLLQGVMTDSYKGREAFICCNASDHHSYAMRTLIEKMLVSDNIGLSGDGFDFNPTESGSRTFSEYVEHCNKNRVEYLKRKINLFENNPKELDKLFDYALRIQSIL